MAVALITIPLLGIALGPDRPQADRLGRLDRPDRAVAARGPADPRADRGGIFLGLLIMGLLLICFSATMPSTLPSLFPTEVRGGALSIAFNVSVSLFARYDVGGGRLAGRAPPAT